jgi:putative hydrolase of the HAD superfamily
MLIDMDDTILSLSDTANRCWGELCSTYAPRLPGEFAAAVLQEVVDASRAWYLSDPSRHRIGRLDLLAARCAVLGRALAALNIAGDGWVEEMAVAYTEANLAQITAFPGAIETIRTLGARGVRLALLTNGDAKEQRRKIERFGLASLFECVVVEGEFGVGKPDERVYRHALACLEATPGEAWMVGDNLEWEVAAPQQLGIYAIWIDFAGQGLPPNSPVRPDRIIRSLSELLE